MANTALRLSRYAMACNFEVIVCGDDRQYLIDVANMALDEIERLDEQLSCFRPTSEVSYLNSEAARRPVVAEPGLFHLLQVAQRVWRDTGGAFDVTLGPIIDLWREAEKIGIVPNKKAIDTAMSKVGMSHVHINPQTNSVSFDRDGVKINLGAIGKGYAVGRACDILREYNVMAGLVSGGGSSVQAYGAPPGENGWTVGIRHPSNFDERVETIQLIDQAMATSGGILQRDKAVRENFEHIIDPATGEQAAPAAVSVTAIAQNAAEADALSTAFYLRGEQLAQDYCRAHAGTSAVFVKQDTDGDQLRVVHVQHPEVLQNGI